MHVFESAAATRQPGSICLTAVFAKIVGKTHNLIQGLMLGSVHFFQREQYSVMGGKGAPWNLFHDNLEVAFLREGAKVLDDVAMAELRVKDDFLVERLDVPDIFLRNLFHRHSYLRIEVSEYRKIINLISV